MEKQFKFHAQIQPDKITVLKGADAAGDLVRIEGWSSTAGTDRDKDVIQPEVIANGITNFMKNPILLYMHDPTKPIGRVTKMEVRPKEGFWIEAVLSAASDVKDIVTKIQEGILRAFSIGFKLIDGKPTGDVFNITDMELWEVSVVSIPANADALFSMAKGMKWGSDLVVSELEIERIVDEKAKSLTNKSDEVINPEPGKGNPEEAAVPEYAHLLKLLDEQSSARAAEVRAKFMDNLTK